MNSTYNLAFPALLYPGLNNKKAKDNLQWSLTPPKYPDYLKLTLYGKLAVEQHNLHQHREAIKTSLDEDFDELDLRLPTFWNSKDKSKNVEIGSNGLDLKYIGPGKQETHAALVRSNFPMRHQCGVYYFEMKVLSKGEDGFIGIGFCCAENNLERLPGWDANSWGYHGDDGHFFAGSGTGREYGPSFTTADVVGCGVDFADGSAFFTKNGKFLGTAFKGIDPGKILYPSVGLRTLGEKVTVNFGHEPFVYDIEQYIKDQKYSAIREMTSHKINGSAFESDQLVLSYLIHHGYTKAASALANNNKDLLSEGSKEWANCEIGMEQRTAIRTAIIHGRMDKAVALIEQDFPRILEERGKSILLLLKCGKFIEMMREYALRAGEPDADRTKTSKRRLSYAEIACHNSSSHIEADLSEQRSKKAPMVDIVEFKEPDGSPAHLLEQVMKYGQEIQEEYKHDHSERTRTSLMEIFSLLAYPDPYNSPVAHIMNISRRDDLATEVNAAILGK
ncbi:hypothetical protein G6F60_000662 [Rhizopus arrhizus]|nr:hypothetical protein G6F60_000662 [Rhizopus arrhizus]